MNKQEKSTIAWLAEFAGEKKSLYIASVLTAVVGVAFSIAPYVIIGDMVAKLVDGNHDFSVYLKECVIIALCWILRVTCHGISTTFSHKATFHVLAAIRKRLCDKLARVPLGLVKDTSSGSLKNVIVERVDSIETTLAHVLPEFTANLLAPAAVFVYLIIIDWRMALVSLITLVIGMIAYMGMMIGYDESYKNTVNKTRALNDTAVEYINGIEVIKAFGRAQMSYERFENAAKEGAECYVEWMRRCNVFFCIAMVVMPCTALAVVPLGGVFYMNGSLAFAELVMCLILSLGLISPLITVMSHMDDIAKVKTIVGEVTEILSWEELERPAEDMETVGDHSVTLENVTFGYHDKEVLHGINMEIKDGTVNALVGASGSGKSTIAKLIASLWDVKGGSIKIGGADIRNISAENYNSMVAYVSQDNYLFDDTIRENIRMGNLNATDEAVEEASKKCGCHKFIKGLPNDYDTVVGSAGGHLSGGERQRISIARAILADPCILILDEATAAVDTETEKNIQASLKELVKGRTTLSIAHRLSTLRDADELIVINEGKITEQGTHAELITKKGEYFKLYQIQSKALAMRGIGE